MFITLPYTHEHKQTAGTARIARELRRLREQGKTWKEASIELGILKKDGSPDPGLAYRIAIDEYEPKSPEIRERLGLRKFCLACERGFRKVSTMAREALPPWLKWWKKLDRAERERRIREYYEKEGR
jgi:hypothetical protein